MVTSVSPALISDGDEAVSPKDSVFLVATHCFLMSFLELSRSKLLI